MTSPTAGRISCAARTRAAGPDVNAGEAARQDTGVSEEDYGADDGDEEYSSGGDWDESLRAWSLRKVSQTPPVRETRRSRPARAISPSPGTCRGIRPGGRLNLPETDAVPF